MSEFQNTLIDELPLNKGVNVLAYNVDGLVALDKPTGAMSHPNNCRDNNKSILTANYDLKQECFEWTSGTGAPKRAWLINRLDSPTSGVILLGLNPTISALIKAEFASRNVSKVYYAVVRQKPSMPTGSWEDLLIKDMRNSKHVIKKSKMVKAKTRFQVLQSPIGGFPVTLMKLMPLTGRTHQLRIQCQKHRLPIVGDRSYGNFPFNREVAAHTNIKRLLLHSAETHIHYTHEGKVRVFSATSKLPEDFKIVLNYRPSQKTLLPGNGRSASLSSRRFKI